MPRRFEIPGFRPKFLFAFIKLEIPRRNKLAVHIAVIHIDNVRREHHIFFQNFFEVRFFCQLERLRKHLELLFDF